MGQKEYNDTSWEELPDSVWMEVGSYIKVEELFILCSINRRLRAIYSSSSFYNIRVNKEDLLCFVGGFVPVHMTKKKKGKTCGRLGGRSVCMQPNEMGLIHAHIPSLNGWRKFGFTHFKDNWTEAAVVYVPTIGELVYLGGILTSDIDASCTNEVWSYSFYSNQWRQLSSMKLPRTAAMCRVAVVGNYLLVVGSDPDPSGATPRQYIHVLDQKRGCNCEILDMKNSMEWTEVNDAPCHPGDCTNAVVLHDRFVCLLQSHFQTDGGIMFDMVSQSWSALPPLPTDQYFPSVMLSEAVAYKDTYVVLADCVGTLFCLDPIGRTWTVHRQDFLPETNNWAQLFSYRDQILLHIPQGITPNRSILRQRSFWRCRETFNHKFWWEPYHLAMPLPHLKGAYFFTVSL